MASLLHSCCTDCPPPWNYITARANDLDTYGHLFNTWQQCGTQFREGGINRGAGCAGIPYNPNWNAERFLWGCYDIYDPAAVSWTDGGGTLHEIPMPGLEYTMAKVYRLPPRSGVYGHHDYVIKAFWGIGKWGPPCPDYLFADGYTMDAYIADTCCCSYDDYDCPTVSTVTKQIVGCADVGCALNCGTGPIFIDDPTTCELSLNGWNGGLGSLWAIWRANDVPNVTDVDLTWIGYNTSQFWEKCGACHRTATAVLNMPYFWQSGWQQNSYDIGQLSLLTTWYSGTYNWEWMPDESPYNNALQPWLPAPDDYYAQIGCHGIPVEPTDDICNDNCDSLSYTTPNTGTNVSPFLIEFGHA